MPLSTPRPSTGPDATLDRAAQEVTAILNEHAATADTPSLEKRKWTPRASDAAQRTPTKRRALTGPAPGGPASAPGTVTVTRSSGRLKARSSLPLSRPNLKPNGNPVDVEGQAGPQAGAGVGAGAEVGASVGDSVAVEPNKRLMPLNRQKPHIESPFKGRGVVETRSSARVNLDDSPHKQKRQKAIESPTQKTKRKLQRLGRSIEDGLFQRARPTGSRRSARLSGRYLPFDGEPIYDEGFGGEPDGPPTPPAERPVPKRGQAGKRTVRNATVRDDAGSPPPIAAPAATGASGRSVVRVTISRPVASPVAKARSARQKEPVDVHDDDGGGGDEGGDGSNGEGDDADDATSSPLASPAPRPLTDAEDEDVDQVDEEVDHVDEDVDQEAAAAAAERQRKMDAALGGIEDAATLYGCRVHWQEVLVGGATLREAGSWPRVRSIAGKAARRSVERMRAMLRRDDIAHMGAELNRQLERETESLWGRCEHLASFRYREGEDETERTCMVGDVYYRLLPDSLKLAKAALVALYQSGGDALTDDGLRHVYRLLQIVFRLRQTACQWRPRPTLENGVESTTLGLGPHLDEMLSQFEAELNARARKAWGDRLAHKQQKGHERLQAAYEERTLRLRAAPAAQTTPAWVGQDVVDVDDLGDDERHGLPTRHPGAATDRHPHVRRSAVAEARSRARRDATEDIPAPSTQHWRTSETAVLLNALQQYQTTARFHDIVDTYGGRGGPLRRFDMDQIMARARFVKQSMERQLEYDLDASWDWLRSVPD